MNKRVSICIPTYNGALFIEKTIRSVLDSTYSNVEIIISDDGSNDNTVKIIEEIDDKRVCLLKNNQHMGVPKNWNASIKNANGEFIGLLNQDDLIGPFWISFAVQILQNHSHIGWVSTAFNIIDKDNKIIDHKSIFPETKEYSLNEVFLNIVRLDGFAPTFIARRKILEEIDYYDEKAGPGADNDLFLRLASKFPLYYSNKPHASWRSHRNSLTNKWTPSQQAKEGFSMLNKIFSDEQLSMELKQYEKSSIENFQLKINSLAEHFKQKGDMEKYNSLEDFLLIDKKK